MPSRFQTGLQLAKQSLVIIQENKKLLIFPAISSILTTAIFIFAIEPIYKLEDQAWRAKQVSHETIYIAFAAILIGFILINMILLTFNTAMTACVMKHIQKEPYRIRFAFKIMITHAWKLYCYKIVMTTAAPVIRFLEYWYDGWFETPFATKFLSRLNIMTGIILVLPVIVDENCGPIDAIKRSAFLIENNWGTNLISRVGIAGAMIIIHILSLIPIIAAVLIGGKINLIIGGVLTMILFLTASTMNSATQIVLTSALYLFAIGKDVSHYFDHNLLRVAFSQRRRKMPGAS